jgi:uncharacterized lipoprotein YddW (UPF0748 family)
MLSLQRLTRLTAGVILLALTSAVAAQEPQFRAYWAAAWHKGFQNTGEVNQLITDIREARCNAVFVQIRKRGDAYYKGSPFEPEAKLGPQAQFAMAPDFDPLARVLAKAHDTNAGPRVEVHAWFVAYPVTSRLRLTKSTNTEPFIVARLEPRHPFNLHPDWVTESDTGEQFDGQQYSFDPGHPAVQQHLWEVAMDIIRRYDIDGFHFDHLRYASPNWGYNKTAVARFNARFQRTGQPPPYDPDWLQFRRDQITALVRKIYLSAIAIKPGLKVSASTITWAPAVVSDEQWLRGQAYRTALQDWRGWMEEGILDLNVPMVFFRRTSPVSAKAFAEWTAFANDHKWHRHVAIGLGCNLNTVPDTLAQLRQAREATAKGRRAEGVALYSYAVPVKDQPRVRPALAALPGAPLESNPLPVFFDQPAPMPEMPWKTKPTQGHLMGFVQGGHPTNGLDGASVSLRGPVERSLTADATGFYGAVDLPPGSYSIVAKSAGFLPRTNGCSVTAGNVTTSDFVLARRQ